MEQQDMTMFKQEILVFRQDLEDLRQETFKRLDHLVVLLEARGETLQIILEKLIENNKKLDSILI